MWDLLGGGHNAAPQSSPQKARKKVSCERFRNFHSEAPWSHPHTRRMKIPQWHVSYTASWEIPEDT